MINLEYLLLARVRVTIHILSFSESRPPRLMPSSKEKQADRKRAARAVAAAADGREAGVNGRPRKAPRAADWPFPDILHIPYSFLGPEKIREYGNIPEYRGCLTGI